MATRASHESMNGNIYSRLSVWQDADQDSVTDTSLALPEIQGSGMIAVNNDKFENLRSAA